MSDEHELYAAVVADPNDEAPRRALAAHYDAKGDPRGEFIRLQLEIAAKEAAGGLDGKLIGREREMIRKHGKAWAAPLADLIKEYAFHRGFIGEVTLPLDRFLDVAPTLYAAAPIQHLNLTAPRTRFRELLGSPHLGRLTSLSLTRLGLDDEDAKAIARAEAMRTLRWLALGGNKIGRPGVEALAASPWLANPEDPDAWPLPRDSYRLP